MAASQQHIQPDTPLGAQLVGGGATFRVWAPGAKQVYVVLRDFDVKAPTGWKKNANDLLLRDANGYWAGFFPGVKDSDEYRFWVVGEGGEAAGEREQFDALLAVDADQGDILRGESGDQERGDANRERRFGDRRHRLLVTLRSCSRVRPQRHRVTESQSDPGN